MTGPISNFTGRVSDTLQSIRDRRDYLRRQAAEDEAQPGAVSLGAFLERPGSSRDLTTGSASRVAGGDRDSRLEFTSDPRLTVQTQTQQLAPVEAPANYGDELRKLAGRGRAAEVPQATAQPSAEPADIHYGTTGNPPAAEAPRPMGRRLRDGPAGLSAIMDRDAAQEATFRAQHPQGPKEMFAASVEAPTDVSSYTPAERYYQTASGAVVDREAAARANLSDYLMRLRAQYSIPWYQREGYESPGSAIGAELAKHPERLHRPAGAPSTLQQGYADAIERGDMVAANRYLGMMREASHATNPGWTRSAFTDAAAMRRQVAADTARHRSFINATATKLMAAPPSWDPTTGKMKPPMSREEAYQEAERRWQTGGNVMGDMGEDDTGDAGQMGDTGDAGDGGAGGGEVSLDPQRGESQHDYYNRLREAGLDRAHAEAMVRKKLPGG